MTMRKTFDAGREKIQVPVILGTEEGNTLQKQFENVAYLFTASLFVEEVFAVRSSLLRATKLGFIAPETQQEWAREYKQLYGESMIAFPFFYEIFNFVAKKIGEAATDCLIKSVFETFNPTEAFIDILEKMVMIYPSVPFNAFLENPSDEYFVWSLSDEETDFLINSALKPSLDHGSYYFRGALEKLDPDDSRYKKVYLMYLLAMRVKECRRNKKNDFSRFLFDSPKAILFTK
jgi:hypothetical protein